ncbi:MAG: hypothetical protein ACYC67_19670 [Prosthecobacter sp.]
MNRDYFAEMYVAGILADSGWNIYFPRRDQGFDFIITKEIQGRMVVRPVQVKGLYPTKTKTDKSVYGYTGRLTQLHPDMLLAIPFFSTDAAGVAPIHIAYMPRSRIRKQASRGYRCVPAQFLSGVAIPRKESRRYFDSGGIAAMESPTWN